MGSEGTWMFYSVRERRLPIDQITVISWLVQTYHKKRICSRKHTHLRCSVVSRTRRGCKTVKVGEGASVCLVPSWRACSHMHVHAVSCGPWLKAERAVTHARTHRCSRITQGKSSLRCCGFIPLSRVLADLRIPLMWKDTEYFKNKGGEVPPLPSCGPMMGYSWFTPRGFSIDLAVMERECSSAPWKTTLYSLRIQNHYRLQNH